MTGIRVDTARRRLYAGGLDFACTIGRAGARAAAAKREGDGATPLGRFPLRRLLYRADRMALPATGLAAAAIRPDDGWCDAPGDAAYNRQVILPHGASAEALWRDDGIYDLIVVIGHNDDPVAAGLGSAIFLHVASADFAPTAGCVAVDRAHLLTILRLVDASSQITIA